MPVIEHHSLTLTMTLDSVSIQRVPNEIAASFSCCKRFAGPQLCCILTDRGQSRGRHFHTGTVVQYSAIGTRADWAAGAEQTQPLTFLPVTWVGH